MLVMFLLGLGAPFGVIQRYLGTDIGIASTCFWQVSIKLEASSNTLLTLSLAYLQHYHHIPDIARQNLTQFPARYQNSHSTVRKPKGEKEREKKNLRNRKKNKHLSVPRVLFPATTHER